MDTLVAEWRLGDEALSSKVSEEQEQMVRGRGDGGGRVGDAFRLRMYPLHTVQEEAHIAHARTQAFPLEPNPHR
jgi:hypothetical protein